MKRDEISGRMDDIKNGVFEGLYDSVGRTVNDIFSFSLSGGIKDIAREAVHIAIMVAGIYFIVRLVWSKIF